MIFTAVKNRCILHGRVFVICMRVFDCRLLGATFHVEQSVLVTNSNVVGRCFVALHSLLFSNNDTKRHLNVLREKGLSDFA